MLKEFREFAFKGNVMDLAVGVIIGAAFGKIVTGIVDGLIMPLVGLLLPGGRWREYVVHVGRAEVKVGNLLGLSLDFVIVAFVLFLVVNRLLAHHRHNAAAPPPDDSRECPACHEKILKKARRCKFCTENVEPIADPPTEPSPTVGGGAGEVVSKAA
jgi:large conductance mechanosensitive channel